MTTISRPDASDLIQKNIGNPNFVILDVRTADEFKSRHIAGAIDMDYESSNFKVNISKLDKNKQYLVYCGRGTLGAAATQLMVGLGFKEVRNIAGGFTAWVQDGYITCGFPGKIVN